MTIQLTTPFNPGDADPDHEYTHVKITGFNADLSNGLIMLTVRHGYYDGEDWADGVHIRGQTIRGFSVEGEDYASIVTKITSAQDVLIYGEVARELYQWLLDKEHFAGELV